MTAREMSLVEGYVSASDFLLTSKIQDIPVWLIREIIRSGLMVSSTQVLRQDTGHSSLAHQGDHQVRPHGQLTTGS